MIHSLDTTQMILIIGIENILPYYYGAQIPLDINQDSLEIVDSLNITKVMKDTMSLFWVKACQYQKRK